MKINGTLEFITAFATSDRRWKKSIKQLSGSLATIQQLDGVSYLWRRDEFPDRGFDDKRQVGLIAQDVEKVLPEVVKTDSQGYKSISYSNIVPVLIEALKTQQKTIEKLQAAVKELQSTVKNQSKAISALQNKFRHRKIAGGLI